jgi:N-acetylmuramoyl-L-alanine amidase
MRFLNDWRRSLRFYWYRADVEAWFFSSIVVLIVGLFLLALKFVFTHQEEKRRTVLEEHRKSLECLARNIYYEARGEPLAGQYAVAEVTMNRAASARYPSSVCDVVHQKNWDPLRKRYVGAFSWTEFKVLPEPSGAAWQRARRIAEAVYYGAEPPRLQGAMYFHAVYIKPDWSREKTRVTRIGRHVFYK